MSRVQADSFLTLHYRLSALDGVEVVNTFGGKPATLSLGSGHLSQTLEQRLLGLQEGARASFELAPGEAFGPRDQARQQWVARKLLDRLGPGGQVFQTGDLVQFPTPDGMDRFSGTVRQIGRGSDDADAGGGAGKDAVLIDFNHPLAGMALRFEVQLIGVL